MAWRGNANSNSFEYATSTSSSEGSPEPPYFEAEGNAQRDNMDAGSLQEIIGNLTRTLNLVVGNQQQIIQCMNEQRIFQSQQNEATATYREQQAARQKYVKLDSSTFPTYEDKGNVEQKLTAFAAWEVGVRHTLNANDAENLMGLNPVMSAIIASFRGEPLKKAGTLKIADFKTLDEFMEGLRSLFCGAAVREVAYNLFNAARQGNDDDINTWWSHVHGLWLQGFAAESRAVSTLIRQFVHGLKSLKLAKMMLGDPRGLPEDYEAVRLRAIESQGQIELMEAVVKERQGKNPQAAPPYRQPLRPRGGGGGIPMDVNAAGRGRGKPNAGGVFATNPPGAEKPPARRRPQKDQCLNCGGKGHWRDECPSPKKPAGAGNGAGAGRPRGGPVMNVDVEYEDAEEEEDDEEDFVGCAEMGAGNAQGQA